MFSGYLSQPSVLRLKSELSLAQSATPVSLPVPSFASLPSILNKIASKTLQRHTFQHVPSLLKTSQKHVAPISTKPKVLISLKDLNDLVLVVSLTTILSFALSAPATLSPFLFISHTKNSPTFHLCCLEHLSIGHSHVPLFSAPVSPPQRGIPDPVTNFCPTS